MNRAKRFLEFLNEMYWVVYKNRSGEYDGVPWTSKQKATDYYKSLKTDDSIVKIGLLSDPRDNKQKDSLIADLESSQW